MKSALFTTTEVEDERETVIIEDEQLTKVFVTDHDPTDYVRFEAEIRYPAHSDVVQDETFGCYVDHTGKVVYGLELVTANGQTREAMSIDNISRILVDIWEDSSVLMSTLITPYQQSLLDLVFFGKPRFRDKFSLLLAEAVRVDSSTHQVELRPKDHRMEARELEEWTAHVREVLLDGEDCENELRQVIDEIQDITVLPTGDFVVQGSHGMVLVYGDTARGEEALSSWLFLNAADVFLENVFHRLFMINSSVVEVQKMMGDLESDPNSVEMVQDLLVVTSSETSFIDEIVVTLEDALGRQRSHFDAMRDVWTEEGECLPDGGAGQPTAQGNLDFSTRMGLDRLFGTVGARVTDLKHVIYGTQLRLNGLRDNITAFNERRMHQVQRELQENSRTLEDITRTNERTGSSLQILELILAAALAFEIINMTIGEWTSFQHLEAAGIWDSLTQPGVILTIAIMGWLVLALLLIRQVRASEREAREYLVCRITYNSPCNVDSMNALINFKRDADDLIDVDGDVLMEGERVKASWRSTDRKWREPLETTFRERLLRKEKETEVTVVFDRRNGYLLSALVEVPSPPDERTIGEVEQMLTDELVAAKVFSSDPLEKSRQDGGVDIRSKVRRMAR